MRCCFFTCTLCDPSHLSSGCLFCVFPLGQVCLIFINQQYEWRSLSVQLRTTSALPKLMHLNHDTVQNCNGLSGFVSLTAAVIDQSDVIKHISHCQQVKEKYECVFASCTHVYRSILYVTISQSIFLQYLCVSCLCMLPNLYDYTFFCNIQITYIRVCRKTPLNMCCFRPFILLSEWQYQKDGEALKVFKICGKWLQPCVLCMLLWQRSKSVVHDFAEFEANLNFSGFCPSRKRTEWKVSSQSKEKSKA